ncbi:MAG TPA: tyrosine-protein phosphatase [Acidimicrobiales bacterium]|nr:tyrosine-protein phosphatase [Acidimicrobiales bacterium]
MTPPTLLVEREDGELVVRWAPAGPGDRLVVGESPEEAAGHEVDHDGSGEVHLRGLDPSVRHYVHLHHGDEPVAVAAERLVPLEGTLNFRDLGGYRTVDGRQVRWGRVFRSDALGQLTDADLTYLERLGVRLVCDFRDDHETQRAPSRLPAHPDLRMERFPIGAGGDTTVTGGRKDGLTDLVLAGQLGEVSPEMLGDFYVGMLEGRSEPLVAVLDRVADPANHPLVFHCTAGKDRTGVLAAILLSVLGVDDETILDDYELTDRYRTPRRIAEVEPRLAEAGVELDKVRALFSAPRPVLARTLTTLEARYGSVERFLTGPAGMGPATLERLRSVLLA